ncbi:type II CAAX endopeptidase family protein [Bacillus xiapuensis]|uniref:Type II CAAX endopeptidase family protein n=1 Tax=Bacillus xiapuensis TaxID=2014075 RepID=A0ABU6N608_9BACI|nr:type II CAAX endopeptidase family protein [Bacillus xiapuensis]
MIFGTLIIGFLILIYPFLDIKFTKPLKEKKDSYHRMKYFKFVIYSEWIVTSIILLYVLFNKAATFKDIGLSLPNEIQDKFIGMIIGFCVGLLFLVFILMRLPFYKKRLDRQVEEIDYLLPTNSVERKWSVFVAITAGICEEIIYRGFVIYFISSLPFSISIMPTLVISSIIFGFGHIYQGWKGFVLTTLIGFVLARAYSITGSLLFPIILHIIIDLRSFLSSKKIPKGNDVDVT